MRTNIDIDNDLPKEAQRLLGTRTKRETVDLALPEVVVRERRLRVLELEGRVPWEGALDESRHARI